MTLRLCALVVPLALDTFAVCAALAAGGLARRERRRVGVVVVAFEGGMPIVGLLVGRAAASLVGGAAEWLGLACLVAIGIWLLIDDEESGPPRELGLGALLLLGVAVSVDELALGFAFGLVGIPIASAIAVIAVQALAASQLGFRLGARIARAGARATRGAGWALVVVTGALATAHAL